MAILPNRFLLSVIAIASMAEAFAPSSRYHSPATTHATKSLTLTRTDLIAGSTMIGPIVGKRMKFNNIAGVSQLYSSSSDEEEEEQSEKDRKEAIRKEIFWAKQRALAAEMTAKSDAALKREQQDKFAKRRLALVSDTVYFSILISSLLWLVAPNPFVTISYLFGALSGTAYSYGLGKYVETIGGSIDDEGAEAGAGVGSARFAFLILLFVVVGKFRAQGLLEIPSIMGFFTYQLASLNQGLREIDD